ncbi:MAG: OmpA family protein [Akkermansiaceae bacterium]|nr:OmpA family protein [Akkermansiaceae bacterium]
MKQSARLGLMKLAILIDRNPEMYCVLEGHTDLFGTDGYNLELSRKRAQAVKDWLVKSLRLDGSHIIVRPFGRSRAKVLEGSREEQAVNRRVDILMRKQIPPEQPVPVRATPNLPAPAPAPAPAPRAIPVDDQILDQVPRAIPLEVDPPRAIPAEPETQGGRSQ